jgi:hypothetical protein
VCAGGEKWGYKGFIKIMKDTGATGLCGIAMQASYPVASSSPSAEEPAGSE